MKKLEQLPKRIAENKKVHESLENRLTYLEKQKELLSERLDNLPKPSFIEKIRSFFFNFHNEKELEIRKEQDDLLKELSKQFVEKNRSEEKIKKLEASKLVLDVKLAKIKEAKEEYKDDDVHLSTDDFWAEENYEERQMAAIWQSNEINFKRGLLFLKAMKVHKVFLQKKS